MTKDNTVSVSSIASTETTLILRVRQQDERAWERLAQVYSPVVYRWGRSAGLQPNDAADVVQEVFRSVARTIDQFRRDTPGQSFRGWLWTITRNKVLDHHRQRQRGPQAAGGTSVQQALYQLPESLPTDEARASSQVLARRLLEVLQSEFELSTFRAFWRMAVDGLPAAEVAEELGLSRQAVRQAKYRVLKRLRAELDIATGD